MDGSFTHVKKQVHTKRNYLVRVFVGCDGSVVVDETAAWVSKRGIDSGNEVTTNESGTDVAAVVVEEQNQNTDNVKDVEDVKVEGDGVERQQTETTPTRLRWTALGRKLSFGKKGRMRNRESVISEKESVVGREATLNESETTTSTTSTTLPDSSTTTISQENDATKSAQKTVSSVIEPTTNVSGSNTCTSPITTDSYVTAIDTPTILSHKDLQTPTDSGFFDPSTISSPPLPPISPLASTEALPPTAKETKLTPPTRNPKSFKRGKSVSKVTKKNSTKNSHPLKQLAKSYPKPKLLTGPFKDTYLVNGTIHRLISLPPSEFPLTNEFTANTKLYVSEDGTSVLERLAGAGCGGGFQLT
ncbi:hypothetical protein HDU76_010595, partial [Blyttiomyces sp. JEL0837]